MLCPEVWNFSPPDSNCTFKNGNINTTLSQLNSTIDLHYFNHLVSVVIPDVGTSRIPEAINTSLVEDCDYYRVKNINANELISKTFIESYVKKGQITIFNDNINIDRDNAVAVTPSGILILSLLKETYQELGLEGSPSTFCQKKSPTRYVVCLDLKASHFHPGKKNYDRAWWCLTYQLQQKFNLLVIWEPPEVTICPSSIAAYFVGQGYEVSVCHPRWNQRSDYNVAVPTLGVGNGMDHCRPMELVEWLGAYSIAADLKTGAPDNFINTYQCPNESSEIGRVMYLQWTGFFTSTKVRMLFEELRKYAVERPSLPWISLYVQGFVDSAVSWGLKEHTFYAHGDNNYGVVLKPDGHYLSFSILSSNKRPKASKKSKYR